MKIAFVNYFQKLNYRGAETYVQELSDRLSLNHSVKIFSASKDTQFKETDHQLSLFSRLFLTPHDFKLAIWTLGQLKHLKSFDPDVIFCLHAGRPAKILRLWAWAKGKKLVIPGQSGPGWFDRINILTHPDLFVCLTRAQLSWAKKALHWPDQKFAVIPNGVDLESFKPDINKLHLNLQSPIILSVAASTPAKRLELTIKAVARLKKGSLLIVGRGPLDQKINQLGESLLEEGRFLHLAVKHSDMPAYYQSADLFTLVSDKSEAFGIVYLEALASNLPCVATLDASRREIIGTAGVYVKNPLNIKEYAQKLEAALARKWKDIPRHQAEKFSWDNIAKLYEKTLETL